MGRAEFDCVRLPRDGVRCLGVQPLHRRQVGEVADPVVQSARQVGRRHDRSADQEVRRGGRGSRWCEDEEGSHVPVSSRKVLELVQQADHPLRQDQAENEVRENCRDPPSRRPRNPPLLSSPTCHASRAAARPECPTLRHLLECGLTWTAVCLARSHLYLQDSFSVDGAINNHVPVN
jgi:hypothetical protein